MLLILVKKKKKKKSQQQIKQSAGSHAFDQFAESQRQRKLLFLPRAFPHSPFQVLTEQLSTSLSQWPETARPAAAGSHGASGRELLCVSSLPPLEAVIIL